MKKTIILAIILFSFTLSANEKILLDNSSIHQYKGKVGLWENVASQAVLKRLLKKYGSTVEDVREINEGITYRKYLFIPYSDDYIKELEQAGSTRAELVSEAESFIWPITKVQSISSSFGMRNGRLHTGVDLPAARGTPVLAVKDGMVHSCGYAAGHGNSILLEHRDNYYTRYSHNSVHFVKRGDYVKKGQIIAMVGSTGNSTGNHLHFEVRYKDMHLDPLDFLPENETYNRVHLLNSWK